MRVSHSSSFFLAALAVSSSTSSLAAPAEPGSLDTNVLSSSTSTHPVAWFGRDDSMTVDVHGTNHQAESVTFSDHSEMLDHHRRQLESLLPTLEGLPVVGAILEPLINKLLSALGLVKGGALAVEGIQPNAEQVSQLKSAVEEAIQKMAASVGGIANNGINGTVITPGLKREVTNDPLWPRVGRQCQFRLLPSPPLESHHP
ncbi:hypothetical protein C8Q78DRAFT_651373 [Trametes maxima]|nr:hypothetical protein C8Q78DRAFT_651373 [Trametes maxima]